MAMNRTQLTKNVLTLILGLLVFALMSPSDPTYLRIGMPIAASLCVLVGIIGIFKSIKR